MIHPFNTTAIIKLYKFIIIVLIINTKGSYIQNNKTTKNKIMPKRKQKGREGRARKTTKLIHITMFSDLTLGRLSYKNYLVKLEKECGHS